MDEFKLIFNSYVRPVFNINYGRDFYIIECDAHEGPWESLDRERKKYYAQAKALWGPFIKELEK